MIDPMDIDPQTRSMLSFLENRNFKPTVNHVHGLYAVTATDPETGETYQVTGDDLRDAARELEEKLGMEFMEGW